MNWITDEKPESLSAAMTILEKAGGSGCLFAGGTDLEMQMKRAEYHADLRSISAPFQGREKIQKERGWKRDDRTL